MPGREAWTGDLHILVVTDVDEDDGWEYELFHPSSCKQVPDERFNLHEGKVMVTTYDCDVAWMEGQEGLADAISYKGPKSAQPGCYRIRGWVNVYDTECGPETDTGLALVGV
jgi:hypothetical protein